MKYDVIIAGAGFAGLALARRLKAKVLLIDRYDLGVHQISACGAPVKTMEKFDVMGSVLQEFDTIALHVKKSEYDLPLPDNFCTFDYKLFCALLHAQNDATLLKATVKGIKDQTVITTQGEYSADYIVDATGWQAVLASSIQQDYVDTNKISCGIETEIEFDDDKLRFFLNKKLYKNGIAWLFPAGRIARFGVASYGKDNTLNEKLRHLVENQFGLKVGKIHGGCFSFGLKKPVVGGVFVVGDAAGQTLPLTGEGIRRCLEAGEYCGDLIQKVIEGQMSKAEAMAAYETFSFMNERQYNLLLDHQRRFPRVPHWKLRLAARLLTFRRAINYVWPRYERV